MNIKPFLVTRNPNIINFLICVRYDVIMTWSLRHTYVLIQVSMTGIEKVYWIIYLSLGCIVPIILIIVSYTQIISTIRQTKENLTQGWFQSFVETKDFIFGRNCWNQHQIGRANVDKQQQLSHLIRTLSLFSVSSLGSGDKLNEYIHFIHEIHWLYT